MLNKLQAAGKHFCGNDLTKNNKTNSKENQYHQKIT